jgi:hypothetical protein
LAPIAGRRERGGKNPPHGNILGPTGALVRYDKKDGDPQ